MDSSLDAYSNIAKEALGVLETIELDVLVQQGRAQLKQGQANPRAAGECVRIAEAEDLPM